MEEPAWRYGFIKDINRKQLAPVQRTLRLVELFAILSVLIALLGLLAMSTYFADENTKQIAVRKVFGSDVSHETWRNVRSYMVLTGIACLIGIPLAIWAARLYLQRFAYRVEGYGWVFVVAVLISWPSPSAPSSGKPSRPPGPIRPLNCRRNNHCPPRREKKVATSAQVRSGSSPKVSTVPMKPSQPSRVRR